VLRSKGDALKPFRSGYRLAVLSVVLLVCSTTPVGAQQPPREQPRFGGVLKVAMFGEPPSLDPSWTAAVINSQIMWHVFETLYTFDKDWSPIPHLAEGHTVSDGGRQYSITLRKSVRFHNGKEMTAADVVASLNRWGRMANVGKALWKSVEAVAARGSYEIVVHLKEPSGVLISGLAVAWNGAFIYPKEVIDATGDGQLKQFIGTGPFRFVEHKPDRHVRLARFKEYAARSEPPNGAGGKRVAYLDELLFIPVPDVAVRLAGVESGTYHYSEVIKQDQYNRLLTIRSVEPRIASPSSLVAARLNHKQGLMTGRKLRQAFQAALDMEPIMAAVAGHPLFYRLDPALFPPELVLWRSKAGGAAYNQNDKDKARRLLKEAGYTGQPVRWLTTKEYEHHYKTALVAKQQLEEVGFKIDLQVLDFATLVQRQNKPELFDVTTFGDGFYGRDPALHPILRCTFPGWWCLEEKERLLGELAREADARKRKAIIDRIQVLFYEDVGWIKFGDQFSLAGVRKELRGDFRSVPFFFFWNAWLEKK
jgi:peptide/nickel transport system substrate-binding protein